MGDLRLPSLPPDFVPNFLTQPGFITNDTNILEESGGPPPLQREDPSREDRFPRDSPFLDELEDALNNLAQTNQDCTLSKEQWIEVAALYSQAMKKGLTHFMNTIGAASFTRDLPLESRNHFIELSKNIDSINRYFQRPFDESMSTNYCHKCLTVEGTTPTHWQTELELCGHNATAARESITNQYIHSFHTQMHEWYESLRAAAHDQIILKITNGEFAPEFIRADPRIITWSDRASENTRTRILNSMDATAKIESENNFQSALTQYELSHETDLASVRENYQHKLLKIQDEHNTKLKEAKEFYQKEYQDMIDNAKRNKPVITDPIARKKRRGSVSTINSPIVTKSQPFHMHANSNLDTEPTTVPAPPSLPPQPLDPMMQILQKMSNQFDNFAKRLEKLEIENKNTYTTWDTNPSQWNQPENDLVLASSNPQKPEPMPYHDLNYSNADLYDDPPNDHTFVGEYEEPAQTNPLPQTEFLFGAEEPQVPEHLLHPDPDPDSDCILMSGPPTPTAKNMKPPTPGLRPPERAQRVDFDSGKLATDSFGIPVGGCCNADGSISFSNANPSQHNNRPKKPLPVPNNVTPYSPDQLVLFSKDVIIAHALFAFQVVIPRKYTKPEVIKRYNTAVANSRKPGARQTTLSFATVTAKPATSTSRPPRGRQTTPSAWSKSPSPQPRQANQPRNNTTWVIRPRMRSQGLAIRPFEGNADKLTEWYRQRLQANAGPGNKPALTLLHGAWAPGIKSIFSLTFAGHVTLQTVCTYTALFLKKFDNEHIFHLGNNAMKKIALFQVPIQRDNRGNAQSRRQLFDELSRGGSLAGLHLYDGPTWTPKSTDDPDAASGVVHLLVHDPTGSALGKFFNKPTFMYNKRIPSQIAIPPKPFIQCTRCHRLGHDISKCNRPSNARICYHCGSDKHDSNQHKYQCKEQHSGPICDCPPRCFLCHNARKPTAQSTGHTSLDSNCPLRRYTFVLSDPANADPTPTNV